MQDYNDATLTLNEIKVAEANREESVRERETNFFKRLWRVQTKSNDNEIFKSYGSGRRFLDENVFFRYFNELERLIYTKKRDNVYDYNYDDKYDDKYEEKFREKYDDKYEEKYDKNYEAKYDGMYEDKYKDILKSIDSENFEKQHTDYSVIINQNETRERPSNTYKKIKDDTPSQYVRMNHEIIPRKYDDYAYYDAEYFSREAQEDFKKCYDSWSNLYKSMSTTMNNDQTDVFDMEGNESVSYGSSAFQNYQSEPVCMHCTTKETSLWRRLDGKVVCNACGLYFKMHGVKRPISLKKTSIKKRRRISKRRNGPE